MQGWTFQEYENFYKGRPDGQGLPWPKGKMWTSYEDQPRGRDNNCALVWSEHAFNHMVDLAWGGYSMAVRKQANNGRSEALPDAKYLILRSTYSMHNGSARKTVGKKMPEGDAVMQNQHGKGRLHYESQYYCQHVFYCGSPACFGKMGYGKTSFGHSPPVPHDDMRIPQLMVKNERLARQPSVLLDSQQETEPYPQSDNENDLTVDPTAEWGTADGENPCFPPDEDFLVPADLG